MSVDVAKTYTADDLLHYSADGVWELVDGQLVEKKMGNDSGSVAAELIFILKLNLDKTGAGRTIAESWIKTGKNVRRADVAYVAKKAIPKTGLPEIFPPNHPPSLVVEVVSPGNTIDEIEEKVEEYLRVGVKVVWVALPKRKAIRVYRPDGSMTELRAGQRIENDRNLPGLSFNVGDAFPKI